ncbi:hypothetical protein [uncultured Bacteroides sp.]|uniref:hypothetical protein n=1 Tax=uncultured Bacteroides sp. TaxID=162156 RepID=UPI00262E4167|nr:hypothetical protein [uncultured Bacteroides sp.]
MKFNYVILDSNGIYNKVMFYDVSELDNVSYVPLELNTVVPRFLRPLVKIQMSAKLNRYVKFPFKSYWLKRLLPDPCVDDEAPFCFILTRAWLELGYGVGLLPYLKQNYPNSRFVLYLIDLFHTYSPMYRSGIKAFTPELLKTDFDMILSYDEGESRRYGFHYYQDVYSKVELPVKNDLADIDVFFCGKTKDRLPFVLDIAKVLNNYGLKICFYIVGAHFDDKQNIPGVYYMDFPISYWEYLCYVQKSKCILEVMQNGASGYTLRSLEAICYNKMLLTTNSNISSIKFYRPGYISIIKQGEANEMDSDFLHRIRNNELVDYQYDNSFSPLHLLEYIEFALQ